VPWFSRFHNSATRPDKAPALPDWSASASRSHADGLYSDAPEKEYENAEAFCATFPVDAPRLLPSDIVQSIRETGARCWGLDTPALPRFSGTIANEGGRSLGSLLFSGLSSVSTAPNCGDTCIFSNLPILGGLYQYPSGFKGVYYEVTIHRMDGTVAIGTASKPYPEYRFPGWNRLSAGLHLDDMRKFFEDPDGGQDFSDSIRKFTPGDIVGCGYEFQHGELFFTYNGSRFPTAFKGVYFPKEKQDVYAAIGVGGQAKFDVNFGVEPFAWKAGNTDEWRISRHIGCLSSGVVDTEELPTYQDYQGTSRVPL